VDPDAAAGGRGQPGDSARRHGAETEHADVRRCPRPAHRRLGQRFALTTAAWTALRADHRDHSPDDDDDLVFLAVYLGDAGHDYASIERDGFTARVFATGEGPEVVTAG